MNSKVGALVIVFIAACAIFITINNFKKNKLTTRLLFMWVGTWFSIAVFALFPHFLDYIMRFFNMGNRLFFLTTVAIMILFIFIFYITSYVTKMNRKISRLTQEIAILHHLYGKKYIDNKNNIENINK